MSVLALTLQKGYLQSASFESPFLYMMPPLLHTPSNVQKLLTHTCPTSVLLPSRMDESVVQQLQGLEVQYRPSSEFNPRTAMVELRVLGNIPDLDSVGCAGCIMMFLTRNEQNMNVILKTKNFDSLMYIPRSTYWQLSIFDCAGTTLFGIYP
jgi:hypothetical protein